MKGFSLLELLVVLGLGSIWLLLGVPSYQHFIARTKSLNMVNHLVNIIDEARTQAIASNRTITLCGSANGLQCDGQWQKGQLLTDDRGQILMSFPGLPIGDRLFWQSSLGQDDLLKLAPTGFTSGQRGSFYYCPRYQPLQYGAKIILSDSGRTRVDNEPQTLQTGCQDFS